MTRTQYNKKKRSDIILDGNRVLEKMWDRYREAEIKVFTPQISSSTRILVDYSSKFGDKE
jgi:hypothetical protein